MKTPAFAFIFLFFVVNTLFAQKTISGRVLDAQNRQPLEFALITSAVSPFINTTTDQNGNFGLKSGNQIRVSYIGYKTTLVTVQNNEHNLIVLEPSILSLKDLVLQKNKIANFATTAKIDLHINPVKNTQELFRIVPGLFIAQHAGGGKAEQIFLRGFDSDHGTDIQVSVDGMPVNMVSHAHGQGYADAHFIIPETINHIDFGVGPYYTEHGNLNTAGYISFATFKNIPKSLIQVEAGRFNTVRTLGMFDLLKKNKDKQSAYMAAEFNYTDGPTLYPQKFSRYNVFGKYNLHLTDQTQVSFSISAFKSNWNASGQLPTRAVESGMIDRFGSIDPSEGGNTERQNANLIVKHRFQNNGYLENQLYFTKYKFNLYSNFSFYLNDPINGDEINQAEKRNLLGYSSKFNKKYFWGTKTLQSSYGIGFRHDETNNSRLSNVVKRAFISDTKLGDIQETNAFSFIEQELNAGNWCVNAGVRVDYFNFNYVDKLNTTQLPSQQKAIVSPKINIQYTFNPQVQLFVKAGKGFHSNDTRVVIANEGKEILPAAYGTDLGIVIKPTNNLLLSMAVWQLYLEQEFVYVGDDGNVEPSGKSLRKGIDITARYQLSKHLFANANLNITKPRALGEIKGADYIPLAPTVTSIAGIFYKAQTGLNGGINYRYIKNRPANEDNSIVAKGNFLLDATINYTKKSYEIGVAVENVFNVKWNEAQFATESRLQNEPAAVTELNFTPGTPFFAKLKLAVFF